jgi:predicted aspartyl protease
MRQVVYDSRGTRSFLLQRDEVVAMEKTIMGRVLTEAVIENLGDLYAVERAAMSPDDVRRIVIRDALVDTGATVLSLPTRLIRQLGLAKRGTKRVTTSQGICEADKYDAVRLTIQGRDCPVDVLEVPDSVPVLIGQIPLENLDLVVDARGGKLIGNPEHGGEHMFEMY